MLNFIKIKYDMNIIKLLKLNDVKLFFEKLNKRLLLNRFSIDISIWI